MVSDQEPRYRLVDANGNIVGSLYGKADGSVAIQETDSGSDREVTLAPDGTFSAPSVETPSLSAESASIAGQPSDRNFELIDVIEEDGEIDETIPLGEYTGVECDIIIHTVRFKTESDDTTLDLTVDGDGQDYRYLSQQIDGTLVEQTDESQWRLFDSGSFEGPAGTWNVNLTRNSTTIYGFGSAGSRSPSPDDSILISGNHATDDDELETLEFETDGMDSESKIEIWGRKA